MGQLEQRLSREKYNMLGTKKPFRPFNGCNAAYF